MIACHASYKLGVRQQIDGLLRQCGCAPLVAGEANTFTGYVMRIAAGLGVGLDDSGHAETLRRGDIAILPLAEELRLHTYALHKHQRFGLPEVIKRFLTHAKSL